MLVFLVAVKRNQKYIHFLAHNTTCLVICHFFADFFVPFSRKLGEKPLFSVYNLLHNFSTTVIIETTVSCSFSEKSQRCLMPNIKKLIYKNFQKLSGFSFVQFSGNTCDIQYVPATWIEYQRIWQIFIIWIMRSGKYRTSLPHFTQADFLY